MTSKSDSSNYIHSIDNNDTEKKFRRALGLESRSSSNSPSRPTSRPGDRTFTEVAKTRFIRDGDVPVVMIKRDSEQHVSDPRRPTGGSFANRLEVAEKAVKTERHAREIAERSLAEAQTAIYDLQTKLGHAVLVSDEARDYAQRCEMEKCACERALLAEQAARRAVELQIFNIGRGPDVSEVVKTKTVQERPKTAKAIKNSTKSVGARQTAAEKEPQPVKWWLKSKRTPRHVAKV